MPEQVSLAVAVEIALADDGPLARDVGDERAVLIENRGAAHQPNRGIARGIAKRDVALGVAVEVMGGDHLTKIGRLPDPASMSGGIHDARPRIVLEIEDGNVR